MTDKEIITKILEEMQVFAKDCLFLESPEKGICVVAWSGTAGVVFVFFKDKEEWTLQHRFFAPHPYHPQ